jgi:hypothetical protein
MAKQVEIALSVLQGVTDGLLSPETTHDIPDAVQLNDRKGGDTRKVIIIPVETDYFMANSAFLCKIKKNDICFHASPACIC